MVKTELKTEDLPIPACSPDIRNTIIREYNRKYLIYLLAGISLILLAGAMIGAAPDSLNTSINPEDAGLDQNIMHGAYQMPGKLEAEGMRFELNNSDYLNVTLESSEPIILTLESVPEMVTMRIGSASGAGSAKIILGGFLPLTTYHKYEDDYHNHTVFTTAADGSYTYNQNLSNKHLIFIQPRPSTRFINANATGGDCTLIGNWDAGAKTCTLTTDLTETIQIDSDGITLNGNGHTITGSYTGIGVYLLRRTDVTIKNLNVKDFSYGIYFESSSNNMLSGNNASKNNNSGIYLYYSSNNMLIGNNALSNKNYGIYLYASSNNNTLSGNNASDNKQTGFYLYSSSNNNTLSGNNVSNNYLYDIYLYYSSNNTLTGNNASKNFNGIRLDYSMNNTLTGNHASNNGNHGISLYYSSNNTLIGNNVSNDNDGLYLYYSSNNTLIGNNVSNNTYSGIYLYASGNNTLTSNNASNDNDGLYLSSSSNNRLIGNNLSNNTYSGIFLYYSSNNTLTSNTAGSNMWGINVMSSSSNTIYNNYFNNTNNSYFIGSIYGNNWNITKKAGTNIIGGAYLGGNFWSNPNGSGFSQTCADTDRDGICDENYSLSDENIDHLPLILPQNLPPVADCGTDKLRCENVGSPVRFNGSKSYDIDGSIVSYEWDFADGYSYKGIDYVPAHMYSFYRWNVTAYQPFIVNLTVTDNSGLKNTTSQKVVIWIAGDANGDGKVNILDASIIGLKWGTADPCADLNNDGKVNILDASIIGLNWNKKA